MRLCLIFIWMTWLVVPVAEAALLQKCIDDNGRVSYSDKGCEQGPKPAVAPSLLRPVNQAVNGKLDEALVNKVLQHAVQLTDRFDYRGQCALAAKDIIFRITDETSKPTQVYAGSRPQICAMQRDSMTLLVNGGLKAVSTMEPGQITINADSTKAVAKYRSRTTVTMRGEHVMSTQCDREETLSVYGDLVLYSYLNVKCKSAD